MATKKICRNCRFFEPAARFSQNATGAGVCTYGPLSHLTHDHVRCSFFDPRLPVRPLSDELHHPGDSIFWELGMTAEEEVEFFAHEGEQVARRPRSEVYAIAAGWLDRRRELNVRSRGGGKTAELEKMVAFGRDAFREEVQPPDPSFMKGRVIRFSGRLQSFAKRHEDLDSIFGEECDAEFLGLQSLAKRHPPPQQREFEVDVQDEFDLSEIEGWDENGLPR